MRVRPKCAVWLSELALLVLGKSRMLLGQVACVIDRCL